MGLFQPELTSRDGSAVLGAQAGYAPTSFLPAAVLDGLQRLAAPAGDFDLAIDLGHRIGSRRWWLGLAALTGLCGSALSLGLMAPPLPTLPGQRLTPSQREAWAPLAIAPLARGATTGTVTLPLAGKVVPLAETPERPRLELTAKLGAADSFEAVLRRAGVGRDEIAAVAALVRPAANLGALPRGAEFDIVLGRRATKSVPRPLESLVFRAAFDLRLEVRRAADGGLGLKRVPIAVDSTPLRVQGLVGGSVERALRSAGVPSRLASQFVSTMAYAVDFQHGVGKRDRFDIVVEQDRAETGEVRHGDLLFAALTRPGKDAIELGRWSLGGRPQYFRASGESAKKGLMKTPVDGARLTSGFGMRFHPLLSYSRMHQGVDFGAPHGSPIYAAAGGKVAFAGGHGGHGNYIQLRHTNELITGYAHLSRFAVRSGQQVTQGQVIGYVGSTGLSTGPHLHYEVWLRGRPVNPVQLKFIGGTQLQGQDLGQFLAFMNRMRGLSVSGGAEPAPKRRR